jgi:hypothetical protein
LSVFVTLSIITFNLITTMRFSSTLALSCGLLQAQPALAHPAKSCEAGPMRRQAIYIITNEEENMVLSLPIDNQGMLGQGSMTPTGGAGAVSIDGSTNEPAGADPLVSQSALTIAGMVSSTSDSHLLKSRLTLF